jgi:hypothetical protein
MKDTDESNVPRRTVKLPSHLENIGRPMRGVGERFLHFFENGVTQEGEAYPIQLPIANPEYDKERRRLANAIVQARNLYNSGKPNKADHLTHRVHSEPGTMWVVIVKKYTDN